MKYLIVIALYIPLCSAMEEGALSIATIGHCEDSEELLSPRSIGVQLVNACRQSIGKQHGGYFVVKDYLERDPDFTVCDETGSALMWVCRFGDLSLVTLLINYGAKLDVVSELGYSPLHAAVESGDSDIVALLLCHGADPNAMTSEKATPLHYAVIKGNILIIRILLENGANPNLQTNDGYTPLHFAAQEGQDKVIMRLMEHNKLDIELTDKLHRTPLHIAVWLKRISTTRYLVDFGADVNACKCDMTPLDVADKVENMDLINFLYDQGARRFHDDRASLQLEIIGFETIAQQTDKKSEGVSLLAKELLSNL